MFRDPKDYALSLGCRLCSRVGALINGMITQWTDSTAYSMYLVMAMYVLAGLILLVTVRAAKASGQRVT